MTRNKDQKRLIRTRMSKTGESYTAARAVLLERGRRSDGDYAAPRSQWARLAGMSDAKVRERTGRSWAEWVAVLDAVDAHKMSHRDIARHVRDTYAQINSWWSQTITVGYERIRGLREVGQRRDGAYEANKSRTFATGVSSLYRMFSDARRRKKWLPEGVTGVRAAIADKSLRVDWHDGTRVAFFFVPRGPGKSSVSVQHARLQSKADIARMKGFWEERLGVLCELLE